jgi:hypothetical protein
MTKTTLISVLIWVTIAILIQLQPTVAFWLSVFFAIYIFFVGLLTESGKSKV